MELKILSGADIEALVPMSQAIDAVEHAYRAIAQGTAEVPLRLDIAQAPHESHTFFMPAIIDGAHLGMKIVSVFPHNQTRHQLPTIHAIVMLIDAATGQPQALMDGTLLTVLRTGAASGVATRLLARPDSHHLVIIGAGAQAWAQVSAVCTVRPITHVTIVNRSPERAATLQARINTLFPAVHVTATDNRAQALATADVVCLATSAKTPVFADAEIRPGTHINGIGSFTHTMVEADPLTLGRAYIAVDQMAAAWSESGELIAARELGIVNPQHVVEIGAVATGQAAARTHADQITFFKSVGNAAQDVIVAYHAFQRAVAQDMGQNVRL